MYSEEILLLKERQKDKIKGDLNIKSRKSKKGLGGKDLWRKKKRGKTRKFVESIILFNF